MKFHFHKARKECERLGITESHPVLCRLIDFCALSPSTWEGHEKIDRQRWAYQWRRLLFCADRFRKSKKPDALLIKEASRSRRLVYSVADSEWKARDRIGLLYRKVAIALVTRCAGYAMPRRGPKKTAPAIKAKMADPSRELKLLIRLADVQSRLAEKLQIRTDEVRKIIAQLKDERKKLKQEARCKSPRRR